MPFAYSLNLSGRKDSNLRSLGPKPSAFAARLHPVFPASPIVPLPSPEGPSVSPVAAFPVRLPSPAIAPIGCRRIELRFPVGKTGILTTGRAARTIPQTKAMHSIAIVATIITASFAFPHHFPDRACENRTRVFSLRRRDAVRCTNAPYPFIPFRSAF
jgi:hypothetical protein